MALMQPVVAGPLSELSSSLRVRGQLPGATVAIEVGGPSPRLVAKGVATSGDERFALFPGTKLKHGDLVYAIQDFQGDNSGVPSGNQGMPVARGPASSADLGTVRIATHLYECGRYVWIDGAVPGADVTLFGGGVAIGSGKSEEGTARFALTSPIPPGSWMAAHQSTPGVGGGPDVGQPADAIPPMPNRASPPPVMQPPIRGCDASIQITGVIDGAKVTIDRRSGPVDVAGFDRSALRLILTKPLDEDDELTIRQEVDIHCERRSAESAPVIVGKLEPVGSPQIVAPLCAGGTVVRVTGLRPGAIIHLAANQQVYDGATPPDRTWLDCRIPPLTTDPVSATQELCGVTSAPAAPVSVDPHEDHVPPPRILTPLYSCAGTVSVTAAHRGALLQIFARTGFGDVAISDQVLSVTTNHVVAVSPLLIEGQRVFVRQWACSDTSSDSVFDEVVEGHPPPGQADVLGPLFEADTTVMVRGTIAGSTVEVYTHRRNQSQPEYLGSAVTDALHQVTILGLNRSLDVDDEVSAREIICGLTFDRQVLVPVGRQPGFGPRPFYVFGHNPNTIGDVTDALNGGANGLEPDVQVYEDHPDQICISHGTGESSAPSLMAYLQAVHGLAMDDNSHLALVVFDCKEEVTSADHGFDLLMAIRKYLTFDNDLNVIISVGRRDDNQANFFDRIVDILGPREGLMIDAENDPGAVSNYFTSRGVVNQGYGNGISFVNFVLGPYYRYTLEAACGIRAQAGRPRFIYVWTVNAHDELREYIRIGVDGAITDDPADLRSIVAEGEFNSMIRMANRADNPFRPANSGYGLHMHTADKWMAGTDANVTFTIQGANGSASKTVNTELIKRMESDGWNWVTIASDDLGTLQSLTVQRDDEGNGPDWFLDSIQVRSHRFGANATATFTRWIDDTTPFNEPLV